MVLMRMVFWSISGPIHEAKSTDVDDDDDDNDDGDKGLSMNYVIADRGGGVSPKDYSIT